MGERARRRVEAEYSVRAWAETFVTSVTGISPSSFRPSWKIDRAALIEGSGRFEPHRPRTRAKSTSNQVCDR